MSASQAPPKAATYGESLESDIEPYSLHVSSRYLDLTRRKLELARMPREVPLSHTHKWTLGTPKETLEPLVDFWLNDYDWRAQEARLNRLAPQYRMTVSYPRPQVLVDATEIPTSVAPSPNVERDLEGGSHKTPKPEALRVHFLHQRSDFPTAIPLLYIHGWPGNIFEISRCLESLVNPLSTPAQSSKETIAFHVVAPSIPGFGFSDSSNRAGFGVKDTAEVLLGVMKKLGYDRFAVWGDGWGFKVARMLSIHHSSHILGVFTCHPTDLPAPQALKHKDAWFKYHLAKLTGARIPWLRFGYSSSDFQRPDLRNEASDSAASGDSHRPMEDIELAAARMTISSGGSQDEPDDGSSVLAYRRYGSLAVTSRPQTLSFAICDSPVGLLALIVDALRPTISIPTTQPSLAGRPLPQEVTPGRARSATIIQHPPAQPTATANAASSFSATDILDWTMLYWLPGPEACLRYLLMAESVDVYQDYSSVPLGITWYGDSANAPSRLRTTSRAASASPRPTDPMNVPATGSSPAAYLARTNTSPIWASAVQNLQWVKRREEFLEAGIPAWERSSDAVLDVREFFRSLQDNGRIPR